MTSHAVGHDRHAELGSERQAVLVAGSGLPDVCQSDNAREMGHEQVAGLLG
jgi:hypothetical protein